MSEPYLIAHLVRGQPAFDIAERAICSMCDNGAIHGDPEVPGAMVACDECDSEGYWWIVSTSGHRARPYWSLALSEVYLQDANGTYNMLGWGVVPGFGPGDPPPNWPDHFPTTSPKAKAKSVGSSLLTALGLGRKSEPVKRRI